MRSLAEDIRSRSDGELARLLQARPDLTRPAPADLSALAARSLTLASTTRGIDHLDDDHLATLEAVALLDGGTREQVEGVEESVPAGLTGLLGEEGLSTRLVALRDAALLWRSPDGLAPTRTVSDVLGPHPGGLGPTAASLGVEVPPQDELARLHDEAPPAARSVLDRLVDGGPVATVSSDSRAAEAAAWLAEHRLTAVTEDPAEAARLRVVLPREVTLALRGGLRRPVTTAPREEAGAGAFAQDPGTATAAVVLDLVALVDEVLEHLESARPRVLRSGGLALADLRGLARETGLSTDDLRALLDLALGARLLADDGSDEPTWRLTTRIDTWRESSTAERWLELATPWLSSPRTTMARGESAPRALSDDMVWPPIRSLRTDVLAILAEGAHGEHVVPALRRRRPRRLPEDVGPLVSSLLEEATRLGLLHEGRMGPAGCALVEGDHERAASVLEEHLPAPVDQALVQADLTAVVPGPPTPTLAATLRRAATLESRGGASIYRFDEASIRQALDAGMDGESLLAELAAASRTPLPQGLEYLVRDVARRHGELRAGSAGSYLRSDDEVHLDQLLARRDLSHLQLRRIAPTVLISPAAAPVLVESLREVGAAPVREGSGGVLTGAAAPRRVTPPREPAPPLTTATDPLSLVAAMRRGEASAQARALTSPTGPPLPSMDPAGVAGMLREAAADRSAVWVGVADAIGEVRRVLLVPEAVEGGRVRGLVDDEPRSYSIHRITGVVAVGDQP